MELFKNMSVGKKLYALALFFALTLAGTIVYTVLTLSHQASDSSIFDIAGRQRMLVQKYTKELMSELNQKQVMHSALSLTRTTSQQIVADRAYYTKNIIGKLKREWPDFKGRVNYHEIEGAIPLPATFVKEVSATLSKQGDFSSRLVSKWPVNAELGLKSDFEKKAWDALVAKDSANFYFEKRKSDQGAMIDYATKDVAFGGCVSCHNGLTNSIKTNWKTGELMGILVVSAPITHDPVLANSILNPDHQPAYSDTAKLFEMSLNALRQGGKTYADLLMTDEITLPLTSNSAEVETALSETATLWEQLSVATRTTENEEVTSPVFRKAMADVHLLTAEVLGKMNSAVSLMRKDTDRDVQSMENTEWIILVLTLLIGGWLCFIVTKGIVRPIRGAVSIADHIANGNLNTTSDYDSKDEIGQMMLALERMRQALIASNKERDTRAKEERKTVEAQLKIQQKESDLVRDFEGRIAKVVESVDASARDVGDMATQLSGQAEALMRQSQQAAAGASQGSQHVESTAAASEEISVTISDVSNRVDEALRISEQAVTQAKATNQTLESLSAASEEIDSVVRLIGDIAEQTNLLALNASIEAARAGDAGRGFAVVAGEVKDLANQTANATESISTQIANLQKESKAASSAIDEIGKIIHDVNKVNQDIAEAMNQQTQASREISEGAQMAASGMTTVSNEIAEVTQVADQTNAISGQLLDASSSLAKVIEQQQEIVGNFLENMQGARSE